MLPECGGILPPSDDTFWAMVILHFWIQCSTRPCHSCPYYPIYCMCVFVSMPQLQYIPIHYFKHWWGLRDVASVEEKRPANMSFYHISLYQSNTGNICHIFYISTLYYEGSENYFSLHNSEIKKCPVEDTNILKSLFKLLVHLHEKTHILLICVSLQYYFCYEIYTRIYLQRYSFKISYN